MKRTLTFLLLVNSFLLYSQESDSTKYAIQPENKIGNSIYLDSIALSKNREMNASAALSYESCNLMAINSSYFSPLSSIAQRGSLSPIFSLNGIPLQTTPPYINLFSIESIELTNESFNRSSTFLNGTVNLELKRPKLNKPLHVEYEGNLVSGGVFSNPILYSGFPYYSTNGSFISNNISIEKGTDKYAFRFSFSNAFSSFDNSSLFSYDDYKTHLSYNTLGFDFSAKPDSRLSINTNFYLSFKTVRNENSSENASDAYDLIFFNLSGIYELSKNSLIRTQIGAATSSTKSIEGVGVTPGYAKISIESNRSMSEKSTLQSSLSYSFLNSDNSYGSISNSSSLHSVVGAAELDLSRRLSVKTSLSNEVYNDGSNNSVFILVPSLGVQLNLLKANEDNEKGSCTLFANYAYSNRETDFVNLNQKFEAGVNSTLLHNRIGLSLAYYTYIQHGQIYTTSDLFPGEIALLASFESFNQGVEVKNKNTVIRTHRVAWNINTGFAWNKAQFYNIKTNGGTNANFTSLFPEFKFNLSSELVIKNFMVNCLFDSRVRQKELVYDPMESSFYSANNSTISFRQVNISYTIPRNKLEGKKVKQFAVSVYFKNGYTRWSNTHYIISSFDNDQKSLGINFRIGF